MSESPFSLKGKRILVTGASSGIGKSVAIECSKAGASLIITGRNEERLQATYQLLTGENHQMVVADLAKDADRTMLIQKLTSLDGIVLCAGQVSVDLIQFSNIEKIKSLFDVNLFSTIELCKTLYKKKLLNKQSSVVCITSLLGNYGYVPANSAYGASKSALSSWMKYAAIEFAPRGIRVNSICPGGIETPILDLDNISADQLETDKKKIPLKRYGKPEEVAYSAVYLLSDATCWITGTDLVIDGGRHIAF
jgi:NAD(P)-dependent dehydrogenase (short-subunit alcohol dehydrogenase family)